VPHDNSSNRGRGLASRQAIINATKQLVEAVGQRANLADVKAIIINREIVELEFIDASAGPLIQWRTCS
jgi:hypothetical protein